MARLRSELEARVEACEEAEAWHGPGAAATEASRAMETGDTVRMTAALIVADRTDPSVRLRAVVHAMLQKRWGVARAAAGGLSRDLPLHVAIAAALDEIASLRDADLSAGVSGLHVTP